MTAEMAKATFDAQGIYFDEHKQWYKKVSNRFVELPMGCFESTDGPQTIFGNSLKPYTSVITQMYNNGTKLFIKELYGVKLGEKEHNGCVQVVDTSMGDGHIYLYAVIEDRKKEFFKGINKVTATEKKDCEIIEYEMVL
ncbi:hypothetical protein IWQ62_006233 [Dispira parvispora]|uniref:Uncharacterized protein n=1 Tax=Dispira parvispora TaxID=1520584 RepID=A0A9W8AIV1_9FUNG|nr:hypothetical protein IWQ62_006233 [Dispira parvispora]